ncbi:photosystem I light harvesting complex gene 5 [Striga asiatica]|uniref:Photosystem I light harvesting complex gene 5 n=1 Tax=Striga asiatica TaxID=4170 RepID=A0A5A7R216_STRAF|nr:photosystem I light harvesting complex gene 5 [Striga asiatica]
MDCDEKEVEKGADLSMDVSKKEKYEYVDDDEDDDDEWRKIEFLLNYINPHAFDSLYTTDGIDLLAEKISENMPELKELVLEIRGLLNADLLHTVSMQNLDVKAKEILKRRDFLEATEEALYYSSGLLVGYLEDYCKTKDVEDRMLGIKQDPCFEPFLGWTDPFDVMRGTLCILFGYLCDEEFHTKLTEMRIESHRLRMAAKPPLTRSDLFSNIDYPANLNGLKQALADRYGEESCLYKVAIKTIEDKKPDFEEMVCPSPILLGPAAKGHKIRSMNVLWFNDTFVLGFVYIEVIF